MPVPARAGASLQRGPERPAAARAARRPAPAGAHRAPVSAAGNLAVQRRARGGHGGETGASGEPGVAVSRAAGPLLQRCGCGGGAMEETLLQRSERGGGESPSRAAAPPRRGGSRLDGSARAFMEPRFGRGFGGVRVHTGADAARRARALDARAFTVGQDIWFGAGEYQPHTPAGRRLLAHELTHTVQQSESPPAAQASLRVSRPGDALEREADRVAGAVAGGAPAPAVSAAGGGQVQRDLLDDIAAGGEAVLDAAGDVVDTVADTAGDVVDTVSDAAGDALDWLADEAGQAAMAGARALISLWGGTITIRGFCIEVDIPSITLFPTFQKTLGETPPIGFFVPLLEGGAMIGPFPVAGMAGILAYAQGSLEAAVGPGEIRGIHLQICPLSASANATAQLYAAAALGGRLTLFGGLFVAGGTIIPFDPPIPVIAILQGGLRGIGTLWGIGAVRDTVALSYTIGGSLTLRNDLDLMAGLLLQGDLDLYAALRLYEPIVCDYAYRLGHWETGEAWQLSIPMSAVLGPGGGSGTIGPPSYGSIPISAIETAIRPPPVGFNCLSLAEVKQMLCDNGFIPPAYCPPPGAPPSGLGPGGPGAGGPGAGGPGGGGPGGGGPGGPGGGTGPGGGPSTGTPAGTNRIRLQLQHKNNDVVPSETVDKNSAVTVAEGHAAVDAVMGRTGKTVNKACQGAAKKMKKTMSGYPPTGVSSIGNVARKWCDDHPDYEKGIRMDLENLAGTNFTS